MFARAAAIVGLISFSTLTAADLGSFAPGRGLPFTVDASEDVSARFAGAPRIHSFAWGQWEGKWIFIGGRTSGYHGVGGSEVDFPRATANSRIWVVDPTGNGPARTFSIPLEDLPESLATVKDQWASSNPAFFQDGESLYIAGGYGRNSAGSWVTYPVLSSVRLPQLVDAVVEHRGSASAAIHYTESPLVQVTGGEMLKLGDAFYVIGGHVFMGTYSEFEASGERNTAEASQKYTGEIRKIRIQQGGGGEVSVQLIQAFADSEFARRDLNVAYRILPDGHTVGAAAYGGVFTKDQLGFTKPVYWDAATAPAADKHFDQTMSGYTCAHLQLFDSDSHAMYTTFFGGISRWTWNYAQQKAEPAPMIGDQHQPLYFDGLTWIDHITTLAVTGSSSQEMVQSGTRMPGYIGSNTVFLPVTGLPKVQPEVDVYDLKALRGKRVLVGYLFGGIRAYPKEFPYRDDSKTYRSGNVPTKASDLIVPVYVMVPAK